MIPVFPAPVGADTTRFESEYRAACAHADWTLLKVSKGKMHLYFLAVKKQDKTEGLSVHTYAGRIRIQGENFGQSKTALHATAALYIRVLGGIADAQVLDVNAGDPSNRALKKSHDPKIKVLGETRARHNGIPLLSENSLLRTTACLLLVRVRRNQHLHRTCLQIGRVLRPGSHRSARAQAGPHDLLPPDLERILGPYPYTRESGMDLGIGRRPGSRGDDSWGERSRIHLAALWNRVRDTSCSTYAS